MNPLIQSFTKNLSPCSGCGKSDVEYFVEQQEKGEKVKFQAVITFDAETSREALQKLLALDANFEVLSHSVLQQRQVTTGTTIVQAPKVLPVHGAA